MVARSHENDSKVPTDPKAAGHLASQLGYQAGAKPEVRHALVARVRGQIDNGTYLAPDKLEIALDRLIADIQAA